MRVESLHRLMSLVCAYSNGQQSHVAAGDLDRDLMRANVARRQTVWPRRKACVELALGDHREQDRPEAKSALELAQTVAKFKRPLWTCIGAVAAARKPPAK